METNKIDKIVKDAVQSRKIQPSSSAWERLSDQLETAEQAKQTNWFKYAGYAASVLLIISVAFFMNRTNDTDPIVPEEIVIQPIDTTDLVKPTLENTAPVETVIVQKDESTTVKEDKTIEKPKQKTIIARNKSTEIRVPKIIEETNKIVIAENRTIKKENPEIKTSVDTTTTKQTINSRIVIDADALLYAVANPDKDIREYYAKYNVNRDEVLKTIQKELKKTNLKIEASVLLADVEKNIDEESFKRDLMQVVTGRITGLASAFANRNN